MTESAYLVGLRLTGKKVVVVGGGTVAQRRLPLLIASGADVHVISRSATRSVEAMTGITLALREYRDGDLDGAWYTIAATDDAQVNEAVVAEAESRRIFCVRADIAAEGQIMLSLDEIQETAEAFWRQHGLRPNVVFRTRSIEAVRSLVATGAGIAVLPDLVYRPWSLEGDRIEARPMVEQMPPVRVAVAWRRGSPLPEPASRFLDVVLPRPNERD